MMTAAAPTPTPIPILVPVGRPGSAEEELVRVGVGGDVVESGLAGLLDELPLDGDAVLKAGMFVFVFVLVEELGEDPVLCVVLVVGVVEESVSELALTNVIVVGEPPNAALGVCPEK